MKDLRAAARHLAASVFFLLTLTLTPAFTRPAAVACDVPTVSRSNKTASSLTYAWNTADAGATYELRYLRLSDNATATVTTAGGTATFSGLTAGTYRMYFKVICGGSSTEIVIDDEVIY